jgi:GT2 family glycosyltransferase
MNPKLSIIILNWNGKEYLQDCLASVFAQEYDNFKVILVDNHSTDDSVSFVRQNFPKAEIIELSENYGFAKGNNIGIKYALEKYNPDYIFLLNNDTKIVQKDALQKLIEIAETDKKTGILGCRLIYPDGKIQNIGMELKPLSRAITVWIKSLKGPRRESYTVDIVMGAAFLINRVVIDTIGLFDEDFSPLYYEETDYCMRARRQGYLIKVAPSIAVIHYAGQFIKKQPHNYVSLIFKKNSIKFITLHFPLYLIILRILYELYLFLRYLPYLILERQDKTAEASIFNIRIRHNLREALLFYLRPFLFSKKELKRVISKRGCKHKIWY